MGFGVEREGEAGEREGEVSASGEERKTREAASFGGVDSGE